MANTNTATTGGISLTTVAFVWALVGTALKYGGPLASCPWLAIWLPFGICVGILLLILVVFLIGLIILQHR